MPDTSFLDWPFFEARHRALAEQLDEFAKTKLAGLAHGASDDAALDRACREIVHRLGAEGFLNQCCVAEPGGRFDVRSLALSRETLARHGGLADFCFAMQGLGSGPISLFGNEAQKRKYLPRVAKGEISAFALTETNVGSDPAAMATHAEPTPDGKHFILNGEKLWCTNGTKAGVIVVMARTPAKEERGAKKEQITAFIVEMNWPGVEVVQRCRFMGLKALYNGVIRFTDVRVPHSSIFGGEGKGLQVVQHFFNENRIRQAASSLGAAEFCIDEAVKYAKERKPFGKPLASNQAIQFPLVELHTQCEMLRALIHKTAWSMDTYGAFSQSDRVSMCNYWANRLCCEAADRAMQVFGGLGYSRHQPFEHIYRHHRRYRITVRATQRVAGEPSTHSRSIARVLGRG